MKKIEALKRARDALLAAPTAYRAPETIAFIDEALAEQPAPPPECKTDAEKTAFAFGWWKALEENRKQAAQTATYTCGVCGVSMQMEQPAQPTKPLTNAQIGAVAADIWGSILIAPQSYQAFARAIEAAHGIKENT